MIRNVVMGRLHDGIDRSRIEPGLAAVAALNLDGLLACKVGTDAGLRDGSWDFAIVNDFVDAEAYRRYDADEEHGRIRSELFAPFCADFARVQIEC